MDGCGVPETVVHQRCCGHDGGSDLCADGVYPDTGQPGNLRHSGPLQDIRAPGNTVPPWPRRMRARLQSSKR